MEQNLPEWLNKTFLETALQGGEDNQPQVTVISFSAKLAVAPGNNYLSHLYRVLVQYKVEGETDEKSTSIIVKAPITKGAVTEVFAGPDFFSTEPKVYNELLPKMKEKCNHEFGPESFYSSVKNSLILKDMKNEGYIMCDKYKQLDYLHCKYVFKTVAKYHATSVACHHDEPEFIENLGKEQMFVEGPFLDQMKLWLQSTIKIVAGIASEMDGHKPAIDWLLSRIDSLVESLVNLCKPRVNGFNVLNHGDLWVNNMLFKYNESGDIVNLKLIDYQVPRYTSPTLDLVYFIWTSANEDVRGNRLEELFDIYLQTLNSELEHLDCEERLTSEHLHQELKLAVDWAVNVVCSTLPMIICEPDNIVNVEDFSVEDMKSGESPEQFLKVYNGKRYRALIPNLLKQLHAWAIA